MSRWPFLTILALVLFGMASYSVEFRKEKARSAPKKAVLPQPVQAKWTYDAEGEYYRLELSNKNNCTVKANYKNGELREVQIGAVNFHLLTNGSRDGSLLQLARIELVRGKPTLANVSFFHVNRDSNLQFHGEYRPHWDVFYNECLSSREQLPKEISSFLSAYQPPKN